jgi:hypothetical protein
MTDLAPESRITPYSDLPGLEHVVLEESYVLRLAWDGHRSVTFWLDAVLTPEYPLYSSPSADERECFQPIEMQFDADSVSWRSVRLDPARDAAGEIDLGHIDSYSVRGDHHHLMGDFGEVEITSRPPRIKTRPSTSPRSPQLP